MTRPPWKDDPMELVPRISVEAHNGAVWVGLSHRLHRITERVGRPNIIERAFGITWDDKVQDAVMRAQAKADRIQRHEEGAESVVKRWVAQP